MSCDLRNELKQSKGFLKYSVYKYSSKCVLQICGFKNKSSFCHAMTKAGVCFNGGKPLNL